MSETLCAIHQPNFLPRLSTVAKVYAADCWVILDDVQFARRDYQHRCRLAAMGDAAVQQWLILPVHRPGGRTTMIADVRLAEPSAAKQRTSRLIQHYYRRSPYWPELREPLQEILDTFDRTDRLAEIAVTSTRVLLRMLNWPGIIYRSDRIAPPAERSERLAALTGGTGAATYLCGTGGAAYLNPQPFIVRNLKIRYFTIPDPDRSAIWQEARHVSALRPLALAGPNAVAEELHRTRSKWSKERRVARPVTHSAAEQKAVPVGKPKPIKLPRKPPSPKERKDG